MFVIELRFWFSTFRFFPVRSYIRISGLKIEIFIIRIFDPGMVPFERASQCASVGPLKHLKNPTGSYLNSNLKFSTFGNFYRPHYRLLGNKLWRTKCSKFNSASKVSRVNFSIFWYFKPFLDIFLIFWRFFGFFEILYSFYGHAVHAIQKEINFRI